MIKPVYKEYGACPMPGEFRKRELVDGVFVVTHTIDDSHTGWRADRYLCDTYKHFSRNKLQTMIDEGRIVLLGKRLKASTSLHPGDRLEVRTEYTEEPHVDPKYGILYEDEHLIVVDKPGNLPVHPAGRFLFNTLLMQLRKDRQAWISKGNDFYLIHRIDRETSGAILLAKTHAVAGDLVRQFRDRETEKRYSAIVAGRVNQDRITVDFDIGSDPNSHIRLKMAAFPKGTAEYDALTHFEVLRRTQTHTLLDCQLMTGRQHQIRVHLAAIGFPIVGDKLYGASDQIFLDYIYGDRKAVDMQAEAGIERHALHSRYLKFHHQPLGKWIEIESPLPAAMEALMCPSDGCS